MNLGTEFDHKHTFICVCPVLLISQQLQTGQHCSSLRYNKSFSGISHSLLGHTKLKFTQKYPCTIKWVRILKKYFSKTI